MGITRDLQAYTGAAKGQVFTMQVENSVADLKTIISRYKALIDHPQTQKSHFFNGRFENIYPARAQMPEMEPLISLVKTTAQTLLRRNEPLGLSFWFNQMGPGHVTTLHTHDEMDELLSAVFYLSVPQNSGVIRFQPHAEKSFEHLPGNGELLCFDPALTHQVLPNRSSDTRLSVAFNIGLAKHQARGSYNL